MVIAERTTRRRGPPLMVSLVVVVVGFLMAVPAGVWLSVRFFQVIDTPTLTTPGTMQRQLSTGTWFVYQLTGHTIGNGSFSFSNNSTPDLDPGQVTVTGPDGNQLTVQFTSETDTITKNSDIYTSALEFTVPSSGRYTLVFDTPFTGKVLVSRSLRHTVGTMAGVIVALVIGGLLFVTGLVLVCVGVIRRSRTSHAAVAGVGVGAGWSPGGPPPGWYPDPQVPGRPRWWDGTRWTDHRG